MVGHIKLMRPSDIQKLAVRAGEAFVAAGRGDERERGVHRQRALRLADKMISLRRGHQGGS